MFLDDVIHEPDDVDLAVLDALSALGFHPTDEPPTPDCVIGECIHLPEARPLLVTPPPRPEEYASFALILERQHRPAWLMEHGHLARLMWNRTRRAWFYRLRDVVFGTYDGDRRLRD